MNKSIEASFDDETWVSVLQAVEESYTESLRYQTEIEEKNEALAQANQFISGVVSTMSDVLIVTNDALEITQVNAAFLKMTNYEESDVIGQSVDQFMTIKSPEFVGGFAESKLYQDVLVELHGRYNNTPLSISCSCAQTCPMSFKGRVLVGRPVGEVLQAYDALQQAYKELKETQDQMLQTERMASLGRLVAGVAHELNTPISVLQGNLWLLKNHLYSDILSCIEQSEVVNPQAIEALEDLPSLLADSEDAAKQISHIVKELKSFSHQEPVEQQSFDLIPYIKLAADWVLGNASNLNIKLTIEADQTAYIVGSSSKFQQVMMNLIQNSVDAMERTTAPEMLIKVQNKAESITVWVEDNGCGIPIALMDKIFDHFFTTKDVGKGTGLGLSISYQLLQEMDGTLSAWNKVEGGAVFQIVFNRSVET